MKVLYGLCLFLFLSNIQAERPQEHDALMQKQNAIVREPGAREKLFRDFKLKEMFAELKRREHPEMSGKKPLTSLAQRFWEALLFFREL